MDKFRTLAQAADELDRSVSTLREQIHRGRLAATKIGRDWLVEVDEIERYRRQSLGQPGRPSLVDPAHAPYADVTGEGEPNILDELAPDKGF